MTALNSKVKTLSKMASENLRLTRLSSVMTTTNTENSY